MGYPTDEELLRAVTGAPPQKTKPMAEPILFGCLCGTEITVISPKHYAKCLTLIRCPNCDTLLSGR